MQTSNHTQGTFVIWTRPNTTVKWYHEWESRDITGYQSFIDYFNSDNFDGHFEIILVDDTTLKGVWWYDPYTVDFESLILVDFQEIKDKVDSYYYANGASSDGLHHFYGTPN